MNEMDLMDALTDVKSSYIADAAPGKRRKPKALRLLPKLAAAAAILAAAMLFLQTSAGTAAAEFLRDRVANLISTLFPDKTVVNMLEGLPETNTYEAKGAEPEEDAPGFAIYVDAERYVLTREGDISHIRPLSYDPESPLNCEMEIRHLPDQSADDAAREERERMLESWPSVSGLWHSDSPAGPAFDASQGLSALDRQEGHYFVSDGCGGCFHIILRYFLEAAEGHGTRMYFMLNSFRVLSPWEGSEDAEGALLAATRNEVAFLRQQAGDMQRELIGNSMLSQSDINILNEDRYQLCLRAMECVWTALEQTLPKQQMDSLTLEQLTWSTAKREIQQAATAELEGGSLYRSVYFSSGAWELENRTDVLMEYLTGTRLIPEQAADVPDAAEALRQFTEAWFSGGDVSAYLSTHAENPESCPVRNAQILRYSGTENVIQDMAARGWLNGSAAFRDAPDSESCLSVTLVFEDGCWKAQGFDIEK